MKSFRILTTALRYLLIISFCASSTLAEEKMKVGVITPLSGSLAINGTAIKNGVELAQREHPELFDSVKFIFEDNQDRARSSISAFEKLRTRDRIDAVIVFGSYGGNALAPLVEQYEIPMLNIAFQVTAAIGRDYVLRTLNPSYEYADTLLEYLRSQDVRTFYLVRTEHPFLTDLVNIVRTRLQPGEKLIDLHVVNPDDMDFRTAISRMRSHQGTKVDRLGLFLLPEQLISFVSQAHQLNWKPDLYGTDLFESAARIGGERVALDGAIYPDNVAESSFRKSYQARYGNTDQLTFAASAFDMATLLAQLSQSMKDRGYLLQEMKAVQNRTGTLGNFSFRESAKTGGYFGYPVAVKRIREDTGVELHRSVKEPG